MSITLHGSPLYGHSHRVQLALSLMGLPHRVVHVDLKNGAHKTPEFLVLNPFGQVPVLDDDATLADIAGYSYISAAPEGNVDLAAYPNVRAWLARVEALPGFVPFQKTPVGLAA